MIFKAISKTGSLKSCFVCMNLSSSERLAMQNLQIPNTAETRILPKWLFPPCFSDKSRFTSSRPDAVLVGPSPRKQKSNRLAMKGGGFLKVAGGKWRGRPGATLQHHQPSADPLFPPGSTDPAYFNVTSTTSRSRSVKTLDLTANWLSAAQKQHDLHHPSTSLCTLHTILLERNGTIYNNHTLEPFKELGLDSQRIEKLASNLHVHFVNYAVKLVHTRRALSSTIINSHQELVSNQARSL
jgi:hypothetical protein